MNTPTDADGEIRALYRALLEAWNRQNAAAFAEPFGADGTIVGFDGSEMAGSAEIAATLGKIFADHKTGTYIGKAKALRMLTPEVGLLQMIAGVIPDGQRELNPQLNSVQSLLAVRSGGHWQIAHYHNTPAALHGRPELVAQMTEELRHA